MDAIVAAQLDAITAHTLDTADLSPAVRSAVNRLRDQRDAAERQRRAANRIIMRQSRKLEAVRELRDELAAGPVTGVVLPDLIERLNAILARKGAT